jgi:hypothetical protein
MQIHNIATASPQRFIVETIVDIVDAIAGTMWTTTCDIAAAIPNCHRYSDEGGEDPECIDDIRDGIATSK